MYADDLAILASSREELQHTLNGLSVYCKDRNLNVNDNKSKVMVFKSIKTQNLFMYSNLSIDEVDGFKYLGMTFNRRAYLRHSQRILIQHALKERQPLNVTVSKHKYMPVRDIFDLFDTLVMPIVIFDSEIWGINISKEVEQFHLTFMKRILGVKSTTNNCFVYAETGRYHQILVKTQDHT